MMEDPARERLLARFTAYLDGLPAEGPVRHDSPPDLFSLFAEVAALKTEVKLEGRQVKAALEEFRALVEPLTASNRLLENELERCREQSKGGGEEVVDRGLLLELLELHDRLRAGRDQATRFRAPWPARLVRADAFASAMAEGLAINLRRLEDTLARRDVHPIDVIGRPFDPHIMHAGEVVVDDNKPEGVVVGERRRGFMIGDRLLRAAEVVVVKRSHTAEQ